ncbi:MAG: hypothetical protein ABI614_16860 [Planctomycetota bacterium]
MTAYETLCAELKQIFEQFTINPQQAAIHEAGELALSVFPRPSEGKHPTVSIVLAAGLVVPPDLKYLAYGVLDDKDELVGFGRTNGYGTLLATMPPGKYRIRYVAELELDIDREILAAIDDAEARGMLLEADEAASPAADDRIAHWFDGLPSTGATAECVASFADVETEADSLAESQMIGLSPNRKWFCIDIPKENLPAGIPAERIFPYGLLLVEYRAEDGHIVGQGLLPVFLNSDGRYVGRLRVERIVVTGAPDPNRFHWTHIGLEDGAVIARLQLEDLQSLLDEDVVRFHQELRGGIKRLIQRMNGE